MTQDPITDVADFLAGAGLGLTTGTNLFLGDVAAMGVLTPAECVFLEVPNSTKPMPYQGTGGSTYAAEVEVTVRGNPGAKDAPRVRARAIRDALHCAEVSGYYSVVCEDSEPEYVRKDDAGCHEWAVAFTLAWTA